MTSLTERMAAALSMAFTAGQASSDARTQDPIVKSISWGAFSIGVLAATGTRMREEKWRRLNPHRLGDDHSKACG